MPTDLLEELVRQGRPRPNPPQTQRERVAIGALAALRGHGRPEEFAALAVALADALIAELDK